MRRCAPHLAWMRRRVQCEPRRRRHDQPAIWCSTIRSRWHRSADPGPRPRCSRATGTSVHPPVDRQLASVVASDRSSSGRATVNWTELTSQSEGLLSPSQSRHRGHDRERSISGPGGRWVRLAQERQSAPETDHRTAREKAGREGRRMWLGRLRFSAIRSEGADGCRGIFCKEFNAPTAIHCFRLGLQTMNARDDDFHVRPGRIRGGDRGAKPPR